MALMNISWKFVEFIFNNNKGTSVRICVYNVFLKIIYLRLRNRQEREKIKLQI